MPSLRTGMGMSPAWATDPASAGTVYGSGASVIGVPNSAQGGDKSALVFGAIVFVALIGIYLGLRSHQGSEL